MLKIHEINIQNINSITSLNLKFQPGVNILCGTNGVGKTTILDCINHSFNSSRFARSTIRRTVDSLDSSYVIALSLDEEKNSYFFEIPNEIIEKNHASYVQRAGTIRTNKLIYHNISQRVQPSQTRQLTLGENGDVRPLSAYDMIKRWFYRSYFRKRDFTEEKFENLLLAKEVFNKLDSNVTFIDAVEKIGKRYYDDSPIKYIEIMVKTPKGIINMDFLSSGYKACFSILIGIIRSIEERNRLSVENFDGVVLIDEIDLHLHPEWQTKIVDVLKWLIPKAQIIITTHSPHVIQNAEQGEIIPLGIDKNNKMYVRDLPESSEYGYQGWTIEEILVHVMGLSDPRSTIFREKLKRFELALDKEDVKEIKDNYEALISMIHPRNSLATLLRIQADEFFEEDEDDFQ